MLPSLLPRARALVVGVDSGAHRLTVSYRTRSEPVERTVDLPSDPGAAQRAVVVLAGNLARNEGAELAAELRQAPFARGEAGGYRQREASELLEAMDAR